MPRYDFEDSFVRFIRHWEFVNALMNVACAGAAELENVLTDQRRSILEMFTSISRGAKVAADPAINSAAASYASRTVQHFETAAPAAALVLAHSALEAVVLELCGIAMHAKPHEWLSACTTEIPLARTAAPDFSPVDQFISMIPAQVKKLDALPLPRKIATLRDRCVPLPPHHADTPLFRLDLPTIERIDGVRHAIVHGQGIYSRSNFYADASYVRKGEKAITLCMPVTVKRSATNDAGDEPQTFTRFVFRPNWFVLAQTDGQAYEPPAVPGWEKPKALAALQIEEAAFDELNGNAQGFATGRKVAVSPIAALPHKTLFHEMAHVVLGHTAESALTDDDQTPTSIREVEAEAVALICCESLALPGAEFSRGYVQRWLAGEQISERSAQKIFHAADSILKAGRD